MKSEDKKLLLKDLCMRLPYESIVEYVIKGPRGDVIITSKLDTLHIDELLEDNENLVGVRPYLRPLSSITLKEEEEYSFLLNDGGWGISESLMTDCIDWLNAHHFDYRGLINKGLAIEVTENNNPYKN